MSSDERIIINLFILIITSDPLLPPSISNTATLACVP